VPQPDTSARYCDSSSYSGYVEDAVDWQGNKMYFRGFANLDAVRPCFLNLKPLSQIESTRAEPPIIPTLSLKPNRS
jgi:hypothetical protein